MPDAPYSLDSQGVLDPQDATALLNQSKQQLVAQFPYLASNPEFNQDLTDSFSKFTSRGLQRGADYNEVFNQTVAPTLAKWQAKAGQDTAKLTESQELTALDIAKQTGSPTAAVQAFPQLIAPNSKFRAEWVGRISKADESSAGAKFQQAKDAKKLAVVANTGLTPEQRDQALTAIDALKPSLAGAGALVAPGALGSRFPPFGGTPTALPGGTPGLPPAAGGAGVASPMGTSGFVNPNPALRPAPQIFIGKPTPEQAAQLLKQWNARSGGQSPAAGGGAGGGTVPAPGPRLVVDPALMATPIVNAQPPLNLNLPAGPGSPKVATEDIIRAALAQTNNDKDAARQLLADNGYSIPSQ